MLNDLRALLKDYEDALSYTDLLWRDLSNDDVTWRPNERSSAIGWHLGHQAAVAHFMVRNLTAAERSPDAELEGIMDSATEEKDRGHLPDLERLAAYRSAVSERVCCRIGDIERGNVGAPAHQHFIAINLLVAVINHEYQHDRWISEVRAHLGHALPPTPLSPRLTTTDGYLLLNPEGLVVSRPGMGDCSDL
jgi:DinB superfamily